MEVRAIRNKATGRVEEHGVESPIEAVPKKVVRKAGEVVGKVEEPAVDAKAVEVDKVEEPGVDAKALEVSC